MNYVYIFVSPAYFGFSSLSKWVDTSIPGYFLASMRQTRFVDASADIFLICETNSVSAEQHAAFDQLGVKFVDISQLKLDTAPIANIRTKAVSDNFWFVPDFFFITQIRYEILRHFCARFDVSKFLFVEGDNLIYADSSVLDRYATKSGLYCCGEVNNDEYCSGIFFCNSVGALNDFCEFGQELCRSADVPLTDMKQLMLYSKTKPDCLYVFPELPDETDLYIFDPASYGQYLAGMNKRPADPRVNIGHKIAKSLLMKQEFKISRFGNGWTLFTDGSTYNFYNLHIHNKEAINQFTTYVRP